MDHIIYTSGEKYQSGALNYSQCTKYKGALKWFVWTSPLKRVKGSSEHDTGKPTKWVKEENEMTKALKSPANAKGSLLMAL